MLLGEHRVQMVKTADGWTYNDGVQSRTAEALGGALRVLAPGEGSRLVAVLEAEDIDVLYEVVDEVRDGLLLLNEQALYAVVDTESGDVEFEPVTEHPDSACTHHVWIGDDRCGTITMLGGHVFVEWRHAEGQYLGRAGSAASLNDHPALHECRLEPIAPS